MAEDKELAELQAKLLNEGVVIYFSYVEDETSTVEAAITDNFVETNFAVQDHIAIKPRIYRLRGCVGEVVYHGTHNWLDTIESKIDKFASNHPLVQKTINLMQPINAISPIVSNYTQLAKNVVNQVESSFNRYKQMIDANILKKPQDTDYQKKAVAVLQRILETRTEVSLKGLMFDKILNADEPGKEVARKYFLQSVTAHQGNNSFISDIEVTIKEFRIATTKTTKPDPKKFGGLNLDKTNVDAVNKSTQQYTGAAKGQPLMSTTENKPKYMSSATQAQKVGGKTVQVTYTQYASQIK